MDLPQLCSGNINMDVDGATVTLSLNRPAQKNALSLAMYQDLVTAMLYCTNEPAVRVVVLTGQQHNFTSGNDLQDFLKNSDLTNQDHPLLQFIRLVMDFPKPILAAVNGVAYGIGTTILMHCDYVIASSNATLCLPFTRLGLVPEFGASVLLGKIVGLGRARKWLTDGAPFTGAEAFDAGLVHELRDDPEIDIVEIARHWAAKAPNAIAQTKRLLNQHCRGDLQAAMADEVTCFVEALQSAEFKEAATAFLEKRPAQFN